MFIVEQDIARHPLIMALIEARLLHLVRRGWSHAEKRGARYAVMAIDFGAYASKINTASQPQIELLPVGSAGAPDELPFASEELIVPFEDDMRAIRRVELTRDFLAKFDFMQETLKPSDGS